MSRIVKAQAATSGIMYMTLPKHIARVWGVKKGTELEIDFDIGKNMCTIKKKYFDISIGMTLIMYGNYLFYSGILQWR